MRHLSQEPRLNCHSHRTGEQDPNNHRPKGDEKKGLIMKVMQNDPDMLKEYM